MYSDILQRKRVSFADPPVSKEMGYEISVTESPQKANKSTARGPTSRKDSPLRFKQAKFKYPPIDVEKVIIENDIQNENSTEVSDTEKKEESSTKISKHPEILNTDEEMHSNQLESDNVIESDLRARINIDEDLGLAQEIEISMDSSTVTEEQQVLLSDDARNSINDTPMDCAGTADSETQQDIFDVPDMTNDVTLLEKDNDDIDRSMQNNSVDSIKLNVTNDSVIEALPSRSDNLTSLEDTVDIQDMIELNSSVNSDEIFCGKLTRTSTHATENAAEQDTLMATDSVFASLPSSQDTQRIEGRVERDIEFVHSTQSIYPTLSSCVEPIDTIVEQLTYRFWKQNLRTYLTNTNLRTIGDLAQISEQEVDRMPVKGKSKVKFIKKVLRSFENTQMKRFNKTSDSKMEHTVTTDETPTTSTVPVSITIDESLSCSTPLYHSTAKIVEDTPKEKSSAEHLDKIESVVSDISSEHVYSKNPNLSDISEENVQEDAKALIATQGSTGTAIPSIDETKLASISPLLSKNVYVVLYILLLFII